MSVTVGAYPEVNAHIEGAGTRLSGAPTAREGGQR